MAARRVKLVVLVTCAGALAASGYVLVDFLREERAIRDLGSALEERRVAAAEFLASRRTARAIPALLEVARTSEHGYDPMDPQPRYVFRALDRIVTPRAVPQVLEVLRNGRDWTSRWAAVTLERLDVQTDEVLAALDVALTREDEREAIDYHAARALLRFGQRAVPILFRAYKHGVAVGEDVAGAEAAEDALPLLGPNAKGVVADLRNLLVLDDESANDHVLGILWEIDADAYVFLAELLPGLNKECFFFEIPEILGYQGMVLEDYELTRPLVASRLEGFLRHERYKVRAAALMSIAALRESRSEVFRSVLQEMQRDEDDWMRDRAERIDALAEKTPEPADKAEDERPPGAHSELQALSALLDGARSTDYSVHLQAHAGLEDLLLDARAVPILEELLRDGDLEVRAWAAHALGKLGTAAAPAARALRATVDDFALSVRIQSALGLLAIGREKADAVAVVMEDLYFSPAPDWLKEHAMCILAAAAAQDAEVLSLVLSRKADSPRVKRSPRLYLLRALEGAGPLAPAVVPLLAGLLRRDDADLGEVAAAALAAAGASARGATPEAIEAWKSGDAGLRRSAIKVLAAIDPGVTALATFLEALERPDETVSLAAAEGLAGLGPAAAPAVPALIERPRRNKLAHAASYALVKIGPPAAAPLVDALTGAGPDLRSWVAYTLGGMGGAAEVAVPALVRLLGDENDVTRMNAAEALGRLGPLARAGVSALETARGDRHPEVRRHAGSALFRIACGAAGPELAPGHRRLPRHGQWCGTGLGQRDPPVLHSQLFCSRWRKDQASGSR